MPLTCRYGESVLGDNGNLLRPLLVALGSCYLAGDPLADHAGVPLNLMFVSAITQVTGPGILILITRRLP
jgi:hypothetical protein